MANYCVKILSVFLTTLLVNEQLGLVNAQRRDPSQKAKLFSQRGKRGNYVDLYDRQYRDLRGVGKQNLYFDNTAWSTCVRGIWLFYDSYDFSTNDDGQMEFFYHVGDEENCVDFRNIGGRVSSARMAGNSYDFRSSTLTLYQHTFFRGRDYGMDRDSRRVDLGAKSIIVTGNECWTLYDKYDFGGNCKYIHSDNRDAIPEFIDDTRSKNVPFDSIRSVQRGCNFNDRRCTY